MCGPIAPAADVPIASLIPVLGRRPEIERAEE